MSEKILIVDDELPIRKILTRFLEGAGYQCKNADGVASAKVMLETESFDLLLSDLKMPGETGLGLIRYAKAHYPDMGRIMISAFGDPEIAGEIMEVGILGYIVKPVTREIVLITVQNSLLHLRLNLHLQAYRNELEKKVSQRTEKLTAIMNNLDAGVMMVDLDMQILEVNRRMQHLFPSMPVGSKAFCFDCLSNPPSKAVCEDCPIAETFTSGKTTEKVRRLSTVLGERDFRLVASPVIDKTGAIYAGICFFEDITERLLLENDLRQAQKFEAVGQLAAGVAHELNTPIQYVGDNIRFLNDSFRDIEKVLRSCLLWQEAVEKQDSAREAERRLADDIEGGDISFLLEEIPVAIEQSMEGVSRVEKIVRAMKDFSHPGSDEKLAMQVNSILESTITVSRNEWKYVAEMVTDLADDLPLVPCFASELSQVFLNIIVNGSHAISDRNDGGQKGLGKITIATRKTASGVEIRINDTGGGIPKDIQERVFEPFFTTKARGKGTGQGLTLARQIIVDKHQGALSFETEQGQGTTFIIELPVTEV